MAITVTSPSTLLGFIRNGVTADASGCEEVVEAVAGKRIAVMQLTINAGAALTVTIGEGESGGAVETALIGPIAFAANTSMQWVFNPPMELTAAKSLTVDASGAGALCVFCQGTWE